MDLTAIIPVKGFATAKERLSPGLEPLDRALLATITAGHVIETCVAAGCRTLVVTDDVAVADLAADLGADHVADPGSGLDDAVRAGVAAASGAWIVLHADLPLLDVAAIRRAAALLDEGSWVIAPSRDGGTNLVGGTGRFDPAYGPASFHRHLGWIGRAGIRHRVIVDAALAVEIDTPADLAVAAAHPGGAWLRPFLS